MKDVKLIAHTLVQNEGRFIWYAINSVLPYIDQIMVWDMSSTDGTWEIINSIQSKKIAIKKIPAATNPNDLTNARQRMLEETGKEFTWLMILDGDEVWPGMSIKKVTDFARNNPDYESIVVRTNNLVGDIYHRLLESAGHYRLAGHTGHLNLRLMNLKKIEELHVEKPHGQQGYFDKNGVLVQNRDLKKIKLIGVYYHHATHLQRSSERMGDLTVPKRKQKLKYELGEIIPSNQIPEILFRKNRPEIVPNVIAKASLSFWLKSAILTLPHRLKRQLIHVEGY